MFGLMITGLHLLGLLAQARGLGLNLGYLVVMLTHILLSMLVLSQEWMV